MHRFHDPDFGRSISSNQASMTSIVAAKPGPSIDMTQTRQQEQGTAPSTPRAPKRWELFWRIIAGLMLLIIAWIVWVLYQITPRSVVTPLAYAAQVRSLGAQQPATGTASARVFPQPPAAATAAQERRAAALPVPQPTPEAAAAAVAMDQAQAGARSGAHQSSADVQAAAAETSDEELRREQQHRREGLKLSTEITTPLVERNAIPEKQQGNPEGAPPVPAATEAAGNIRP
jgi:hypothetical protein